MGLTFLRLLLLPLFLWFVLDAPRHPERTWSERVAALAIFVVMAVTDKLDGYLARRWNQVTRLGALLDPLADKLLVAISVLLLSFEAITSKTTKTPMTVVVIIYGGYLTIAFGAILLYALIRRVTIEPRPLGKFNTFFQLTMVILTLLSLVVSTRQVSAVMSFLHVIWWIVSITAILTCIDYLRQGFIQFNGRDKPIR